MNTTPLRAGPYTIPTGHMLFPSLKEIMMGGDSWRKSNEFDPTRFIDNDGSCKGSDKLMNFSTGKRSCPGQTLAEKELFLCCG